MALTHRSFEAGEKIIREDDVGDTVYIIHSGKVEISKRVGNAQIHIASLGPGDTIGEMSVVDDAPRSATAVAVERTEVQELHKDEFSDALRSDPDVTLLILKVLFERLREGTATVARLQADASGATKPQAVGPQQVVELTAASSEAIAALGTERLRIDRFPFRIGRASHDPLVHNDLSIEDSMPWQISRHHLALVNEGGRIGVVDRGSQLGCLVDGKPVGGRRGVPGPVFFEPGGGALTLGNQASKFEFQVAIRQAD